MPSPIARRSRIAARRPVERREEAVAGGVDLVAAERARARGATRRGAARAARASARSPSSPRALGRADDVGEEHGREHAVGLARPRPHAGEELLDLVDDLRRVARPRRGARRRAARRSARPGCAPRSSDPPRSGVAVAGPVQHERRHADRRQDVADVDLRVHRAAARPPRRGWRCAGGSVGQAPLERRVLARRRAARRPCSPPRSRSTVGDLPFHAPPASAPTGSPGSRSASRRCRRGRAQRSAPGRWRRTGRSCCRPPRSRTAPRAPSRRRPARRARRPYAPRASAGGRAAPGPTGRSRACRRGSAARTTPAGSSSAPERGSSHISSTFEIQPGTKTRSIGPSPTTW